MFPDPGRYVGEAAADAIAQRFAAGQALAHQAAAAGGTGAGAGAPASPAAATAGGEQAAPAGLASSRGADAQSKKPAPGQAAEGLQLGWDELEWASLSDQEAAEAGSAGPRQPGALQRLVARRLRLPLRLSRAAYESEEGFRRLTGIACSALVDDRLFDAQAGPAAHALWACLASRPA